MLCVIFVSAVQPKDAPFLLHALLVYHYWNGAFYPVGGPSEIAFQMSRVIEHHGGRVLVQAPVTDILCDDSGRAIGECGLWMLTGGRGSVMVFVRLGDFLGVNPFFCACVCSRYNDNEEL